LLSRSQRRGKLPIEYAPSECGLADESSPAGPMGDWCDHDELVPRNAVVMTSFNEHSVVVSGKAAQRLFYGDTQLRCCFKLMFSIHEIEQRKGCGHFASATPRGPD
jgi:hypothetical protein